MKQLRKVYNKYIPCKGYNAITILIWMFIREELNGILPWWTENHENIHYAQERELGYIPFYILYGIEYLIKLLITFNHLRAYFSISTEQEAYNNMYDMNYLNERKHYAWLKYVFKLDKKWYKLV